MIGHATMLMVAGKFLIKNKSLFPTTRDKISGEGSWRNTILLPAIYERENWLCWVDGCYNRATSVHEAVISRNDVRGWKLKSRILIHSIYNCIALCGTCHKIPPSKEEVLLWMFEEYDQESVIVWFNDLPFVANPVTRLIEGIKDG